MKVDNGMGFTYAGNYSVRGHRGRQGEGEVRGRESAAWSSGRAEPAAHRKDREGILGWSARTPLPGGAEMLSRPRDTC